MKQVKNFARIFDTENGQVLIVKCNHQESQRPSIEVKSLYENDGCYVSVASVLQYANDEDRDSEFDEFEKLTEQLQTGFDETVKELINA